MFKKIVFFGLTLALTGCSSPPEPAAVKWGATPTVVNSTVPWWQANNVVVQSPNVTGEWSLKFASFKGDYGNYGPEVYYAVAHSTRIVVVSGSGTAWLNAKKWLQAHGATATIEFKRKRDCLTKYIPTCNTVDVYLSRTNFASK